MTPSVARERPFDVERIRADFPALRTRVRDRPLVYLDNAATTQKPRAMIDAVASAWTTGTANVHRGAHTLGDRATEALEAAREACAHFIGAPAEELVFVRGTTEAVNLVAATWAPAHVHAGDEIVVSELEHHSNFVPWLELCRRVGAHLVVAPIDEAGDLDLPALEARLGPRTRLVAVTHVSNVLGTILPISRIVELAHQAGAAVLVDGAQAVPHLEVDVRGLGCDFYCFSGHKVFGPTGIGALFVRGALLEDLPPYQTGGGMITSVGVDGATYRQGPAKLEAGTPDLAGAIGLAAALSYLSGLDRAAARRHEEHLLALARRSLSAVPGVEVIGASSRCTGALSFNLSGAHPHDVATVLDGRGVAIRAGHHCAQPLMRRLGVPGTARASFAFYNTEAEVEELVRGVAAVEEVTGWTG